MICNFERTYCICATPVAWWKTPVCLLKLHVIQLMSIYATLKVPYIRIQLRATDCRTVLMHLRKADVAEASCNQLSSISLLRICSSKSICFVALHCSYYNVPAWLVIPFLMLRLSFRRKSGHKAVITLHSNIILASFMWVIMSISRDALYAT